MFKYLFKKAWKQRIFPINSIKRSKSNVSHRNSNVDVKSNVSHHNDVDVKSQQPHGKSQSLDLPRPTVIPRHTTASDTNVPILGQAVVHHSVQPSTTQQVMRSDAQQAALLSSAINNTASVSHQTMLAPNIPPLSMPSIPPLSMPSITPLSMPSIVLPSNLKNVHNSLPASLGQHCSQSNFFQAYKWCKCCRFIRWHEISAN